MTLKRFQHLLSAYGADIGRWPEAERPAAHALLASSHDAVEAYRATALLDDALHRVEPQISPASIARVLAAIHEPPLAAAAPRGAGRRWAPALLGGMAVLGFLVGLTDVASETTTVLQAGLLGVFTSDPAAGLGL